MVGGTSAASAQRRAASALRQSRAARNGHAEAEAEAEGRDYKAEYAVRKRGKQWRGPLHRTNREVEALPVPEELREAIGNLEFRDAVALVVRSAGVAIPTPELVLLLQNAGVKFPPAAK